MPQIHPATIPVAPKAGLYCSLNNKAPTLVPYLLNTDVNTSAPVPAINPSIILEKLVGILVPVPSKYQQNTPERELKISKTPNNRKLIPDSFIDMELNKISETK